MHHGQKIDIEEECIIQVKKNIKAKCIDKEKENNLGKESHFYKEKHCN